MIGSGRVGPVARALGFAGLLPQAAAAILATGGGKAAALAYAVAGLYGALILSFLGGMWWSIAMQRQDGQGRLAQLAVLPSLAAVAVVVWAGVLGDLTTPAPLVALGSALILTLFVDRHLVTTGEAPHGWVGLRVPLSVGLGGLTIVVAMLADS